MRKVTPFNNQEKKPHSVYNVVPVWTALQTLRVMPNDGEDLGQHFYFTHKRAKVLQAIK